MATGCVCRETGSVRIVVSRQRGVSVFELLLVTVFLGLVLAAVAPAYLSSREDALHRRCSLRLAVIQSAKREVFDDMNLRLPPNRRLRINDRVNAYHLDSIARITLESPWNFDPEEPCPNGGVISVGDSFLEPPSCSLGTPIAVLEASHP